LVIGWTAALIEASIPEADKGDEIIAIMQEISLLLFMN
jgi:hypothetical protein